MAATMDNYDAVSFLPSPLPFGNHNFHHDYMSATSNIDPLDQYSNFDSEAYASGDDMSYSHGGLAHQAVMKRMSHGAFEDPFAHETISQFDHIPGEGVPESPSMDRDSKYLSFSMPHFPYQLFDENMQQCYVNIQAQLHGMFFLAESQWPTSMDTAPPPPELTCYRRNLFQITGNIIVPRGFRYVFTEQGRIPIYDLELSVSATESVEGNPVKIISVPWKTPSGTEPSKQDDKAEKEPPMITLDPLAGPDLDADFSTLPIQWKRLQFRIATANNGRRKELQQHFTLHLKVMATTSTGDRISIAESHSGAVIVRGRSPRNFAARKDVPLSSSSTSRKHVPSLSRSGDSATSVPQITSAPTQGSPGRMEEMPMPRSHPILHPHEMIQPSPGMDLNGLTGSPHFPLPEPSPTSFPMSIPSASITFTGDIQSPDLQPFPFAFSPPDVPPGSGPRSLHMQSDDEGGASPFPQQQQSSRTSSRPPTSNPSPLLMNKPRAATYANTSSPGLIGERPQQRSRLHSHNASTTFSMTRGAPGTSTQGLSTPTVNPQGMSLPGISFQANTLTMPIAPMGTSFERPSLIESMSHTSYDGPSEDLYQYFPLAVDEWRHPDDGVFRPHVVHHAITADLRSPSGRSNKRYFSEVA